MSIESIQLAERTSYLTPSRYVSGRIVEYDIKSANITMLRKYNAIDDKYFNFLSNLPKQNREIEIGLLIKQDIKYFNIIKNGIMEAKKKLFEYNNIEIPSIVRIANDAVYISSSNDLLYTQFDDVLFVKKSISSSMIKLNNLLIFLSYNIYDELNINIKGIKEENQILHAEFMITFIANILYLIERVSPIDALNTLNQFYDDYINLRLPKEYYREFNSSSYYKYKYGNFYLSEVQDLNDIDINYNLFILRELWSIVLEKCNLRKEI